MKGQKNVLHARHTYRGHGLTFAPNIFSSKSNVGKAVTLADRGSFGKHKKDEQNHAIKIKCFKMVIVLVMCYLWYTYGYDL